MDDEFYEDTGELQMPRDNRNSIILSRIPEWLYEHISNWDELTEGDDNDQIVLGEVLSLPPDNPYDKNQDNAASGKKATQQTPSGPPKPPSMRIFMNKQWHEKTGLPTAFEINGQSVNKVQLQNTYIFTEKDLPGYKANGVGRNKPGSFNSVVQDPKARINKPGPKYRRAIPKETALIGSITDQYVSTPLNTKEFIDFNSQRTKHAVLGRNTRTEIIDQHIDEVTAMNKLQESFTSFIRPTNKNKSQQNKYNRMPQNELIDMLHSMFDDFKYWTMKAIKAKVKQPEAYLKETLPRIAEMVRSGTFASTWKRQETFNMNRSLGREEVGDSTVKMEDDDEDDEMEDVLG